MIVYPNAKINIGLNIIEKRPDGFHNIESCFLPISLCDILEIISDKSELSFNSTGIPIPGPQNKNLCIKAWELLNDDYNIPIVKMHLHKQIPIGGGLGGGSADGAFTLKALDELFELSLSIDQLENYADQLGSDCTFFIRNRTALATGKGENLKLLNLDLDRCKILLINPGIHIPTAEAYSGITPKKPETELENLVVTPISNWNGKIHNAFEESIFPAHPEISDIKANLINQGASYAAMSGSGSSVFGIFNEEIPDRLFHQYSKMFTWVGGIVK